MIIKSSIVKLAFILLFVTVFPLVQNQWLNLYLFDINNFSVYKLLYYLSGLICPIFVCINSLSKFTYYKFRDNNFKYHSFISGKILLFITSLILITLSILIYNYFFIGFNLFLNLFINDSNNIFILGITKKLFFVALISISLIFKKIKLFIKKIVLFNFFIISIFIWYSQINNILINQSFIPNYFLIIDNINHINILSLLAIESLYYVWAYISNKTNLSDWIVPRPSVNDIYPIIKNLIFYLLIIFYYSLIVI